MNKTMIKPQELRLGNLVNVRREDQSPFRIDFFEYLYPDDVKVAMRQFVQETEVHPLTWYLADLNPIPITPETIEKYIDWQFEFGFNKSILEKEYWIETHYLLENIIDGSSDFEIVFCENKDDKDLDDIYYFVDDNMLEFALEDNFHNLQNLFYIASGQELPIKI